MGQLKPSQQQRRCPPSEIRHGYPPLGQRGYRALVNSPSGLFVFLAPSATIVISLALKNALLTPSIDHLLHDRTSPPQYSLQSNRTLCSTKTWRSHNVHLRPHGLRLRTHWQLPYLRFPGYPPALSETPRLSPEPRHESHRR